MSAWPPQPVIYEINAWTWLTGLSRRYGRAVSLGSVPSEEWDRIGAIGADAVWFMGVWQRSVLGRRISRESPELLSEYARCLPGFSLQDICGSPYSIHSYVVDEYLGGERALRIARGELEQRNLRLLLDYVPNHVAPDHPWTSEHPEYFILGAKRDLTESPAEFFQCGDAVIAHGRDPYFAPWPDTAQLNVFNPDLRSATTAVINNIADLCDGVRCDMAMLLLNNVFARTWGARAGAVPDDEYWRGVIEKVRRAHPEFLFIAEAYWDLEDELLKQGFDLCYDKRLYDRLAHDTADGVRLHLRADVSYQRQMLRFLENHDEPRAAVVFPLERHRAAAVVIATVPGAKLLHEGQMDGCKIKLSVHLGCRPEENANEQLGSFYRQLLAAVHSAGLGSGRWQLCEVTGWTDNDSYRNVLGWTWLNVCRRHVVVVNFSAVRSQARVQLDALDLSKRSWSLRNLLTNQVFAPRDGDEMIAPGLFVDMEPWVTYLFEVELLGSPAC